TTSEIIISHCRQHLAGYKTPKQVFFVDALPRNALGKVQKAKLRADLCATSVGQDAILTASG
ncbi:MAG: hypothetical protein ACE5EY_13285, partial [Anaerolineae bacterium]